MASSARSCSRPCPPTHRAGTTFWATEPSDDGDAQICLWALYEMHYRGFEDAPDDREWQPEPLTLRRGLETRLRERVDIPTSENPFAKAFFTLVEAHEGPSLASFVQRESTTEQTLELLRHRSIYHLKESDSTAWVVHGSRSGRRSR